MSDEGTEQKGGLSRMSLDLVMGTKNWEVVMEITRHDGKRIGHAEKKLLVFHCIDVVPRYDCESPPVSVKITQRDIELANVMGARLGKPYSSNLIGKDISFIPDNVDLITMPNWHWRLCKQKMKEPLQDLLNLPGVACAVLTKAIHRKRPNLIPVCDAIVVEDILGANSDKKNSNTILMAMEKLRDVGQKNLQTLQQIRDFLVIKNELPDLSNLRMLEVLYWMEKTDRYRLLFEFMQENRWWV